MKNQNPLSPNELTTHLKTLPDWSYESGTLTRLFKLPDFPAAIAFVNRVADLAEEMNHHPDIDIRYRRVTLSLVTHSAGGVTSLDIDFATKTKHLVE